MGALQVWGKGTAVPDNTLRNVISQGKINVATQNIGTFAARTKQGK